MASKITQVKWLAEELAILREYYPQANVARMVELLPRHTKIAIRIRARRLGVRQVNPRAHTLSPESKDKIRSARLEYNKTHDNHYKGKHLLDSTKKLISEAATRQMSQPGRKEMLRQANIARFANPAERQKQGDLMRARYQDPNWLKKYFASLKRRPTSIEKRILGIIERSNLPFKYNGNFELGVTLNGMIPDFVNINGKKQVVEVFGNYWHDEALIKKPGKNQWRGNELGRIMAFNSLGWSCLILKQDEIASKTDAELEKIISSFEEKGGK